MTDLNLSLDAVLNRLNLISNAIDHLKADDLNGIKETLLSIAGSIISLLPGSFAAIYTYDPLKDDFDIAGGVTTGQPPVYEINDISNQTGPLELAARGRAWVQATIAPPTAPLSEQPVTEGRTAVCYPLVVDTDVLGVLYVSRSESNPFYAVELSLLEHLAALAAMTLSLNHQSVIAQQEQLRRERELRRLRRAGMLISSRSSLRDTLDAILNMALEVTDARYGIFRLVDRSGSNLVTQSYTGAGLTKPAVETLQINNASVMGYVALKREPVVISDLREEPWNQIYYPFDHEMQMRSEVAVPLIGASGRLEGVLNLESPEVNAFDREDRYILQILATQAVVSIQEVRLLDALQDIFAMLTTRSLQEMHQVLVERACDLLNVSTSVIWLVDKEQLVVQASSDASLYGQREPLDYMPFSQVIRTGKPVSLMSTGKGEAPSNTSETAGLAGMGSVLVVPLFTGDDSRPVGAIGVYTTAGDPRDFSQSDWDIKVLSILGHYAALAIQNAAYLDALKFAEDQRATTETFAAIGDIAANLLHRLNNKVGTIPVRVEGIEDKCQEMIQADPYLAANLAEIQRSASEAMQVVRESLDHLRPIEFAPVSVAACAREAIDSVRLPPSVKVECVGLEDLPPVQAGANRLTLVFSNLLDNAIDAMEGEGLLQLHGVARGKWVEVRVSDSGPGIPPDLHERIFEFSYSSRSSTHPGKLGFGLWWVKSLMTRFGGKVTVESDGSRGTTFILSLPLAKGEA